MNTSKGTKAIKVLCNTFAIEVEMVDNDTLKYKYSNDEEWIECKIQYLIREDDVNGDVATGFITEDDEKYYLDEFVVAHVPIHFDSSYATDPEYAAKIKEIVNAIDIDAIRNMSEEEYKKLINF